jgi:hypothetical protein
MNEEQWLNSTDPYALLYWLRQLGQPSDQKASPGKVSHRKLRLFKCACCRRVWRLLTEDRSRKGIEAVEAVADGELSAESFEAASQGCRSAYYELAEMLTSAASTSPGSFRLLQAKLFAAHVAYCATAYCATNVPEIGDYSSSASTSGAIRNAIGDLTDSIGNDVREKSEEFSNHAVILRDIVGNPFRPLPPVAASLLTWNDGLARRLAEEAYQHRIMPTGTLDPDRLAVLADALEEANADAALVAHLRQPGPHVRGCWALDLALGRE